MGEMSGGFRQEAAKSLKATAKENRREKLSALQKSDEYWAARMQKLLGVGQKAEFNEDRTAFHWKIKSVYHGSDVSDIDTFNFAEESTIGANAVYFTVDPTLAIGYAKLRKQERSRESAHLYEARLSNVHLMNWVEPKSVDILKNEFKEFCLTVQTALNSEDYEEFKTKYNLYVDKSTAQYALQKIIGTCDSETLNGGNIKTIAQGVMGNFFEAFVKEKGFDGVITLEGGDDKEYTGKSGVSVVLYNKDKIASRRIIDVTPQS